MILQHVAERPGSGVAEHDLRVLEDQDGIAVPGHEPDEDARAEFGSSVHSLPSVGVRRTG